MDNITMNADQTALLKELTRSVDDDDENFTDLLSIPDALEDTSHVKKEGLPPLVNFRGKKMPKIRPRSLKYRVNCPEAEQKTYVRPSSISEADVKPYIIRVQNEARPPASTKQDEFTDKLKDLRESLMAATEGDHLMIVEEKLEPLIKNWCETKEKEVNSKEITGMSPVQLREFMQDWQRFEELLTEHSKVVTTKQKTKKTRREHSRCVLL